LEITLVLTAKPLLLFRSIIYEVANAISPNPVLSLEYVFVDINGMSSLRVQSLLPIGFKILKLVVLNDPASVFKYPLNSITVFLK
jgi:hypothetical protein